VLAGNPAAKFAVGRSPVAAWQARTDEFRAESEPSEERHHLLGHDLDGTVVPDHDILYAHTLGRCDRRCRLPQIVATAAGDVTREAPVNLGERDGQARDPQRQACSLPHRLQLAAIADESFWRTPAL
jgi:hypothetical protein